MHITSTSWFILFLGALFATVASTGETALDAMAMLLFGYSLINLRTGGRSSGRATNGNAMVEVAQQTLMDWSRVKLGGILVLLCIVLVGTRMPWHGFVQLLFGLLAIEMTALLLLESALRFRLLGNASILILLGFFFWSTRTCSNVISVFLIGEGLPAIGRTWVQVLSSWQFLVVAALAAMLLLFVVVRVRPFRREELSLPRLWLFK